MLIGIYVMKPKQVCTVILNWNQPAMTADCVRTAFAQSNIDHTVVVIDNGSTPENRTALGRALPPDCGIVQNEHNLGFAGGMNVGIRYAIRKKYEYLWLLNNDAIPDPNCLRTLVAAMDADPTLAAVTPKLVSPDGADQMLGGWIDWETGKLTHFYSGPVPHPTPVGWYVSGAAILMRVNVIRAFGGFDPRFFAYWEEFDLCTRILRHGDWNLAVVPDARCAHLEAASSGGNRSALADYLFVRNRMLFLRRHLSLRRLIPHYLRAVGEQLTVAATTRGSPESSIAFAAVWAASVNRFGRPNRLAAPRWLEQAAKRRGWRIGCLLQTLADQFTPPPSRDCLASTGRMALPHRLQIGQM
jgi:GT2 family glycosyltransferase